MAGPVVASVARVSPVESTDVELCAIWVGIEWHVQGCVWVGGCTSVYVYVCASVHVCLWGWPCAKWVGG